MILIVDDKQENIFSLKSLLQLNLNEVDTAMSGEEALKKVLKNEYELIILDVQMPGMDGFEVAETITGYSKTRNIPIIFLSAVNIDKRFITKGYATGAVDYVTKPFDPDLLLLKVKTFCKLYAQTRELKQMHDSLKAEIDSRKKAQQALLEVNLQLEDKVKERTSELLKINRALEESNTDLQQYASLASHDLQEPLRKIIIFSRLLEEKHVTDQHEGYPHLEKIISSARRMRNLINDLLNYSKLSGSTQFVPTDLNKILLDTVYDMELLIQEKNASITVEELPTVEAIPAQIGQIFQNLLSNALKFSKENERPSIKVWSEKADGKSLYGNTTPFGDHVRIYVEDNGIGFNEQYLNKIFTIFQRLHGKDDYEGTGIGLAIVKKIIEKHHGILTAKSSEGKGSVFILVLPIKQPVTNLETAIE